VIQTGAWSHTTVLLHQAVQALVMHPEGVYVDGTFGRGGHSRAVLAALAPTGRLIAFDKDPEAMAAAALIDDPRFAICHASFADMTHELAALGVQQVQGVLLDLGVSSPQIDNPERGFSFRHDAPLDMRMDTTRGETAAQFLQRADQRQIEEVIREYGEERFAFQIAKALVARREVGDPVRSTGELSALVARAVKTELEALHQGLEASLGLLAPGGRLVVISFHSLEDRIVKTFIARESRDVVDRRAPMAPPQPMRLAALGRIKPPPEEVAANPRARSAVLRVAERTEVPMPATGHRYSQRDKAAAA
jgi:16S rRNA (cytosine1402-N4)-methyltransferase